MLKNALIMVVASFPFMGYSDDGTDCGQCCPFLPGEPIESCQLPVGITYPADYELPGCVKLSFAGEYLYWKVERDGSNDIAKKVTTVGLEVDTKTLIHNPGYRSAFRIGAAMTLPCFDNWTFEAIYTWFHHTTTQHFSASGATVIQPRTGAAPVVNASAFKYLLKFNIDFCSGTLARSYYIDDRLIMKPFFGLKSFWSSQKTNLTFNIINGLPGTTITKSGFWGIGPYGGADIRALLWCGTYLEGSSGVTIPFTYNNVYKCVRNYPSSLFLNTEERGSDPHSWFSAPPYFEGSIGLGWGSYLCDCCYHVDVAIGYYFFTSFAFQDADSFGLGSREFSMQGLTVRGQFDF